MNENKLILSHFFKKRLFNQESFCTKLYIVNILVINQIKYQTYSKEPYDMEKTKLLTILIGVTLLLTVINLYGTFNLYNKFNFVSGNTAAEQPTNEPLPSINEQQPLIIQVSADDDPVKGKKNAPVTIIEFSDFQCPFCGRFFAQALPLIEESYIKTGKVKLVYRDFPLSFHQYAQKAAEAAECADEQGKFWEYHDKIFENQNALDTSSLKQYAKDLGLDATKFNSCLDSGKMASEVQKDFKDGASYGVSGTPTFFINGVEVVGAQPYNIFEQIIEQELNK